VGHFRVLEPAVPCLAKLLEKKRREANEFEFTLASSAFAASGTLRVGGGYSADKERFFFGAIQINMDT